ncbi:hypothetical protein H257_05230 [Aphanomyces astaci]|uniref:Uncharacterized protein n=1 Tax=Aphanomyces astaci TaxID=112090 RepID=W4GSH4_APHAT|nr:hypothetical protein H257_05230 [Aphanomyces astaci]ETV82660.1 hypothetical protein H257_05230 [Aphanomyces astaci]|eukprot:XP_009828329.1 hypothetical protein H257_05230 [Aphanomyces astaci]
MVSAKERKKNIVERKLRDLSTISGRYQSSFVHRNVHDKSRHPRDMVYGRPWESLFMRKSRRERRNLVKRPWDYPMGAQHLAAIVIQKRVRGLLARLSLQGLLRSRKKKMKMGLMHRFIALHNGNFEDKEHFRHFCASRLQAWYKMKNVRWRYHLDRHPMYHIAAMQIQYKWRMFFQRTLVHGDVTPRERAVIRIQAAWRCYTNRRIYRYYRDLINFRNSGDPMVMLRAINPSEASLLDASTNAQVRFRLGGSAFPPTIYYKIFTRGAVCDMNAFSPKDYTTARQIGPRNVNIRPSRPGVGVTKIIRVGNAYYGATQCGTNTGGWYRRWDNNGWRPVTSKVIAPTTDIDPITVATANRPRAYHHLRVVRQQQVIRQRKEKKRQWMKQLYMDHLQGKASDNNNTDIVAAAEPAIDFDSPDWEAQATDMFNWADKLDFDDYVANWTTLGTTTTVQDELPLVT